MLCQTIRSMLITVEPKLVVAHLLCPKFSIVLDLCSHIIYSVQGKWLVLNFSLLILEVSMSHRVILDVKYWGWLCPPPPNLNNY